MTQRTRDRVRDIARAVLYEGYVLWPYRRSALKNQRRWTFGGVFPATWTQRSHADDACVMRTECLVEHPPARDGRGEPGPDGATISISVRFLQIVERRVAVLEAGRLRFVDAVELGGDRHVAWQEATERQVTIPRLRVDREHAVEREIFFAAASEREWLEDGGGHRAGAIVRSWTDLDGRIRAWSEPLDGRTARVHILVENRTPWNGPDRESALRSAFASTHLVIQADGARFVSLTDPPAGLEKAAAGCTNHGCWPVLAGDPAARDTVLAAPIILSDFPCVAPESPGDLFDGGEIDELLMLNILGLTEAEQEEMRAADPRTREILERTQSLTREQMLTLHGTLRDLTGGAAESADGAAESAGSASEEA